MPFELAYKAFETLFIYEMNFMIPLFYMPFLLWLAFRAHGSSEAAESRMVAKKPIIIHSLLNIIVTLVWILIYGENLMNHDSPWFSIFDVGAPFGMLLLLVVIPGGLITAWWIGPKRDDSTAKKPSYILASRIFYVISIVPSFWMILFYIGMSSAK